jgi:hypothetical protein
MKYVTGVADSQQLGASRRRAAGPGLVILMSKVLERHADSSLKNQCPKQADTPGKLQLGVDCSVSILSRNTRLGWDAALLAPVFFWGILRGGHYYHTPSLTPPRPHSRLYCVASKAAKISHYGLPPNRSAGRVEPWREECRGSFLTAPGSWDRGSREGKG